MDPIAADEVSAAATPHSTTEMYMELDPTMKQSIFCFRAMMSTSAGVWLGNNPLNFSFPILLYQLIIIFITTRATHAILRHLSQPLVISQIVGGIILGPTFLGRSLDFERLLFSAQSWEHLNTISLLSFTFFIFMIGVKTDLSMIKKTGKKAVAIALIGTLLSFSAVLITSYALRQVPKPLNNRNLVLTFAFKWCMTSYTVLSCTLSELNLLTSKLGRLAMSASLIADFVNFTVGAGITAYMIGSKQKDLVQSISSFVAYVAFVGFIVLVARPVTIWIMRRTPEGSLMDEGSFVAVVFMALLCGLISETIGLHVAMGPFLYGLALPGGFPLGVTLVERMERLVVGVFLPLYVAQAGLRMDLSGLSDMASWTFMELLVIVSVLAKFVSSMGVCLYCKMTLKDSVALGLIMVHKGILEVDAASFWLDAQIISREVYTIFILSVIIIGGGTASLIKILYRPEDRFVAYKRRTLQHTRPNAELRIVACIYHQENVHPILTLLESSHPSPCSPVCIYVLHLSQLAGRSASVLAPYKSKKNVVTETDHIVNAFNYFAQQQKDGCVTVIPYICLSPYVTMHDDICSLALDKKASIVLVPFHKQVAIDGTIEAINPTTQNVNINVLHYAPCSVGILVFHGLTTGSTYSNPGGTMMRRVAVYFIGGSDDREALAYGMRMADNPLIQLTLIRFRPPKEMREGTRDEKLDDVMVDEFQANRVDGTRILYREETVTDGESTVAVIRTISLHFDLLIVGRREGKESGLTEGLSVWNEYPELGIVGDLLVSTDFGGRVSTLVVQQQTKIAGGGGGGGSAESPKVQQHKAQVVPNVFDE